MDFVLSFLSKTKPFEQVKTFRKHERAERFLSSDSYVQKLDRVLRVQKPGRKANLK
jgi:hypothetical protein